MGAKPAGFRQDIKALTAEEAEALTTEISGILTDGYERAIPLVIKAFRGRAWVGCGFTSWDAYCKARFVGARMLRIPPAAFTEIALTYADAGMSARAIGSATGNSKDTAARALKKSGQKLADVHGLDDRRQKRNRERAESIAAHPAGKAKAGELPPWETVVTVIADNGPSTYVDVCDALGWRDGRVTGALSEASRRGKITPAGERGGHTVWTLS